MKGVAITGASGGLGRAIALAYVKNYPTHGFSFVLSGRNLEELKVTEVAITAMKKEGQEVTCTLVEADLADPSSYNDVSSRLFDFAAASSSIGEVVFINNAGSLGPIQTIGDILHTAEEFTKVYNLNVTSSCFLTSELVKRCNVESYLPNCKDFTIVNITSLAAIKPFDCKGLYCAGKAARDMYHQVLAEEVKKRETTHPDSRKFHILNYAPGPIDTNMQKEIREGPTVNKEVQEIFTQMKLNNQLIDPNVTSDKMIKILEQGLYSNGDHVDFYDIE